MGNGHGEISWLRRGGAVKDRRGTISGSDDDGFGREANAVWILHHQSAYICQLHHTLLLLPRFPHSWDFLAWITGA